MAKGTSLKEILSQVLDEKTKTQRKFTKKRYFFEEVKPLRPVKECVDEIYYYLNHAENTDDIFRKTMIIIISLKIFWQEQYNSIVKMHDYFKAMTQELEFQLNEGESKNVFESIVKKIVAIFDNGVPQSGREYIDKYEDIIFCKIDLLERIGWQFPSYQYFNLVQGYHLFGTFLGNASDFMYVDYDKFYKTYQNHKVQCAVDYYFSASKPILSDEQRAVDLLFGEVLHYPKNEWENRYNVHMNNYRDKVYYEKYFNFKISVTGISSAITIARAMYVCNVSIDRWKRFLEMLLETDILRNRDSFNFTLIVVLCPVVVFFARPGKIDAKQTQNRRSVFVYMLQQFNKLVKGIQHKRNLNKSIVYWQFIFYSLEYIGYEYIRSGIVSFKEVEVMKILNGGNKERISSEIDDLKKKVRFVLAALDEKYGDIKIADVEEVKEFIRLNLEIIESTIEMDLEITHITSETKSYGSVFDELITSGKSKEKILEEAREKIEIGEWHPWYYAEIEMELRRRNIQ